jgi:hypothetical protein
LPELQYPIHARDRELWRVDFAWPDGRLATEYESIDWHAGRKEMLRDKIRWAKIQELGWTIIPIVVQDVCREPDRRPIALPLTWTASAWLVDAGEQPHGEPG